MSKLSRADLQFQDSTVLLQDNTTSDILPSEHRQANINIHDSFLSLVDDNIDIDLDTSLKYLSDPSGAWDSSPTHDLKLTPKVYVDDFVTSSLSGYAKLDGSNMPFTGNFKQTVGGLTNEFSSGHLLFDDVRGIGSRVSGEQLSIGVNSGRVSISSTTRTRLESGAEVEFGGTSYRFCRGSAASGDYRAIFYPENSATGGGYFEFRHTDTAKYMVLSNRDSEPYNAYFKKAIIVGDSSPTTAGAIRFNGTKHQGYDGTTWHDLY